MKNIAWLTCKRYCSHPFWLLKTQKEQRTCEIHIWPFFNLLHASPLGLNRWSHCYKLVIHSLSCSSQLRQWTSSNIVSQRTSEPFLFELQNQYPRPTVPPEKKRLGMGAGLNSDVRLTLTLWLLRALKSRGHLGIHICAALLFCQCFNDVYVASKSPTTQHSKNLFKTEFKITKTECMNGVNKMR